MVSSGCQAGRGHASTNLEEGQEAIELLLERATVKAGAARIEKSADEANSEVVVRRIDGGREIRVRSSVGCVYDELQRAL